MLLQRTPPPPPRARHHDQHRSCDHGRFLHPRTAPAAVVLPSLRVTLAAGACAAAEQRGNASSAAPTVTCAPFVAAYSYEPALILPPRTTPAAAVGPACALTARLDGGGGTAAAAEEGTRVLLKPATLTCASLAALARGECEIDRGTGGGRRSVEEVVADVHAVVAGALGVAL